MTDTDCLLVAYVDSELDDEGAREAERLIDADLRARHAIEIFRETAALLQAACGEASYAGGGDPTALLAGRRRMAKRPLAWAASIVLALSSFAGGAMWGGSPPSERSELIEEVAGYHPIYSRDSDHLVEVSADQTDHIATWLGGHLALRFVIPDLADAGLQFAGGRMLVVNHRPVAQLMYTRHRGLPVALCVTRMDGSPTPVGIAARGPLRLGSWEDGSFAYVVVGEIEESELIHLTERVRAQLGA